MLAVDRPILYAFSYRQDSKSPAWELGFGGGLFFILRFLRTFYFCSVWHARWVFNRGAIGGGTRSIANNGGS